jgi:hypothetical protein
MVQGEVGEKGRLKAGNDCKWLRDWSGFFEKLAIGFLRASF